MIVVIQCAASKSPAAGYLKTINNLSVKFVANPDLAPSDDNCLSARPDDKANGNTWREILMAYNQSKSNPFGLLPAYKLYTNSVYQKLVHRLGLERVYILSAGWGLVAADFLTPNYDITYSQSAYKYKRRSKRAFYNDYIQLDLDQTEDLIFFGGKDYMPLFSELTGGYKGTRNIYFNSKDVPIVSDCKLIRYETTMRTNWHYGCVNDFLNGNLILSP